MALIEALDVLRVAGKISPAQHKCLRGMLAPRRRYPHHLAQWCVAAFLQRKGVRIVVFKDNFADVPQAYFD